jgi:diguanylate cyclase (GGDEF)-like protein
MQVTSRAILHRGDGSSKRVYYLPLIATALILIAVLDRMTGDVPFQHLYYLPIILAATEFGFAGGLITSLSSVMLYHLANPRLLSLQEFRQGDIVQIILFFCVGLVAAKLTGDADRLRLLAITDDLTGLNNLRSFESHLQRLVSQAKKDGSVLSVLVLDVDRLKSVNDKYGHLAGADAVRTVGHLIAQHLPERAVACRYGGDEFVVAIPDCQSGESVEIAERLLHSVSRAQPILATHAFPSGTLSISIGSASRIIEKEADLSWAGEELFRSADQALYRAKEMGRNGVIADAIIADRQLPIAHLSGGR